MTRVDFYILGQSSQDGRLTLACRLAEKAVSQDHEVLINTNTEDEGRRLDELLWTFSQGSFLPHRLLAEPEAADEGEPVAIGTGHEPPAEGRWDLLINLAREVPEFFSQFARVAELVDADEENKSAGRDRFRYYRERGYELRTHNV